MVDSCIICSGCKINMSKDHIEVKEADVSCCACCGIAEIDDIKLKDCDGCDLVRYCGDECQRDHKSEHEEDCKKRAAELRDELLFKQPEETAFGDCPICSLPLPFGEFSSTMYSCCSKLICNGCDYANMKREREMRLAHTCPFCRGPQDLSVEEADKLNMKRIEMNDPVAMVQEGWKRYVEGDYEAAFEYWTKAAELGHADAHSKLAVLYRRGEGVEEDVGKEIHHLEVAAIGGDPSARYNLGVFEWNKNGNADRAVKHFVIAATQGEDAAMKNLMEMFKVGCFSKKDLAATLRAHKAAVDATKSPQREYAEKVGNNEI